MEVSLGARWVAVDVCDVPVGAAVVSVRATVPAGTAVVVGQADARGAVPVYGAVRCSDGRTHEVEHVGGVSARYITATLVAGPPCVATIDVVFAPSYDRAAPARRVYLEYGEQDKAHVATRGEVAVHEVRLAMLGLDGVAVDVSGKVESVRVASDTDELSGSGAVADAAVGATVVAVVTAGAAVTAAAPSAAVTAAPGAAITAAAPGAAGAELLPPTTRSHSA